MCWSTTSFGFCRHYHGGVPPARFERAHPPPEGELTSAAHRALTCVYGRRISVGERTSERIRNEVDRRSDGLACLVAVGRSFIAVMQSIPAPALTHRPALAGL